MPSNKALKSLIKLLRAQGVFSFECEGLKLTLDSNFKVKAPEPIKALPGQLKAELNRASPGFQGLNDEEVLFWSVKNPESET